MEGSMAEAKVAVALDSVRSRATKNVLQAIGMPYMEDKDVLIKPNLNTSDPSPGSTHIDTLSALMEMVKGDHPKSVTVADRSGPMETRQVFQDKGLFELGEEQGFRCLLFDEMEDAMYRRFEPPGSHWHDGFLFARPVLQADRVLAVAAGGRATARLYVRGAPRLRADGAQEGRGVEGAGAHLHVIGLEDYAALPGPVALQCEDEILEGGRPGAELLSGSHGFPRHLVAGRRRV